MPHRSKPAGRRALVVCDQWLGSNGYAGVKALRRAGWSVLVVPEREFVPVKWQSTPMRVVGRALRSFAVREFNAALIRGADEIDPALLLVFKGTFVMPDTLRAFRERGIRTYCFFPDVSTLAHGPYIPKALPQYDVVFTTKSFGLQDMRALGVSNAQLLPHGFDPDLHQPIALSPDEHERYHCDVSFIGTWSPKKESVLAELRDRLPDVRLRIWGDQWNRATSARLRPVIEGHAVEGLAYVKAIAGSAINLALLSERRAGASSGDQITSRTFHIPAAGGFMLHERTAELLAIFEEDVNVACFDGVDELTVKIRQFLDDSSRRHEIAERGRCLVEAGHSWDHRIRAILASHPSPQ